MLTMAKIASCPKAVSRASELWEIAKSNATLRALFEKLDGVDASEAYHVIKNLSDRETRTLAALVAEANQKFERSNGDEKK